MEGRKSQLESWALGENFRMRRKTLASAARAEGYFGLNRLEAKENRSKMKRRKFWQRAQDHFTIATRFAD